MNVRRGLFRLWLVLSVLWAGLVCILLWNEVFYPYLPKQAYLYYPKDSTYPKGVNLFAEFDLGHSAEPYFRFINPFRGADLSGDEYQEIRVPNEVSLYKSA